MNYPQTQHLFKRVEVAIAMQQSVPVEKAERGDQAIDGLAGAVAATAQGPKVLSGGNRQVHASSFKHLAFQKIQANPVKRRVAADTLQNLAKIKSVNPRR